MTKTNLSKEELQRRKELRDRLLEAIDRSQDENKTIFHPWNRKLNH
ncbi:hypothetical protein [Prochlorococcus marinus]|nr:hypothetical protein [Prochlorococcus marinus]